MLKTLKTINKIVRIALLLSFLGFIIGYYQQGSLPGVAQIDPTLHDEPIQKATDQEAFSFSYRETDYVVEPVAQYELNGLVVSHNDITAFWDIYHDENSVDLKDLCLVWGSNLKHNVYLNTKYYNESVSCHFQGTTFEYSQLFNPKELSNNHLISDSEEVREKIREIRIGDQVLIKGLLVNYYPKNAPDYKRRTSLTRSDVRGGACEVIFVNQIELIKKADRFWFDFTSLCKDIFKLSLIITILLFLFLPWLEYKYSWWM